MHHAYLYLDSLSLLPTLVQDARERFGFLGEHNPDVQTRTFEKFGIDEARELKEAASLRSSSGRALYIVGVSQITTEAQQALLKLFEEPQAGALFILLAPHGSIIATLNSRFLPYPEILAQEKKLSVKTFLAATHTTRLAHIKELLEDEEGVRERVRDFLAALEAALHANLSGSPKQREVAQALEDISKTRSYANDRSPSLKMLLEHLALALPRN